MPGLARTSPGIGYPYSGRFFHSCTHLLTMTLRIRSSRHWHEFSSDEIVQIQAVGNYSLFCLTNGRQLLSSRTLKLYQDRLPAYFIRVHRTCLVNGYFVEQQTDFDRLRLTTGEDVPLSRRSVGLFRRRHKLLHNRGGTANPETPGTLFPLSFPGITV